MLQTSLKQGAEPYRPIKYSETHPPLEGLVSRTSTRWFDVNSSKKVFTPIPFITKSGKFSANTLCFWTAYPEQICACICATVYQRLLKLIAKRLSWKFTSANRQLLLKIAALYTATHDDSIVDRFLGLLKRVESKGPANRLLYHYICNTGENTRFVYNQLTNISLWLTFRSTTCRRDKPEKKYIKVALLTENNLNFTLDKYAAFRYSTLTWRPWTDKVRGLKMHDERELSSECTSSYVSETQEGYWRSEDVDKWSWKSHESDSS